MRLRGPFFPYRQTFNLHKLESSISFHTLLDVSSPCGCVMVERTKEEKEENMELCDQIEGRLALEDGDYVLGRLSLDKRSYALLSLGIRAYVTLPDFDHLFILYKLNPFLYGMDVIACLHGMDVITYPHGMDVIAFLYGIEVITCLYGIDVIACNHGMKVIACLHGMHVIACLYGMDVKLSFWTLLDVSIPCGCVMVERTKEEKEENMELCDQIEELDDGDDVLGRLKLR
uniref:Uncharacterized protein n=1 Tax=Tanacetum cinerariifolium TaxID=118510 RepID=A0A6L2N3J2_TANCI|nr:hypothetical protein [Tanacetum cinerariifolium]